jgi:hypothetical protein
MGNNGKPISGAELLSGEPLREFIMLAGKDSVGKSCAIVSLAWMVEQVAPDAKFYVIDTENKFRSALKGFGSDVPKNIIYYKCDDMNAVTDATADILAKHHNGDWIAVESMSRVWERSQDLAYMATTGLTKVAYLEKRPKRGTGSGPIPTPDDFWKIAKGAHDGGFLDLLSSTDTINCILSTTIAKPPKEGFRESQDKKATRIELGMDANLEGAPRVPYYVETLCLLELRGGRVTCRVLRDNLSVKEESRREFEVDGKKMWAPTFYGECR